MTSSGVIYNLHEKGLKYFYDKDLKYPYVIVSLCLKGSVRWIYDSKEYKQEKNTLSLILPGHTVNVLRHSKDYTQAWMAFDPVKFINYELHLNNINKELFEQTPVIQLTNEEADKLLHLAHVISDIAAWDENELPNKHQLLDSQLTLAHELYIAIRRKRDCSWHDKNDLFKNFCDLVATHYKEEKNVNFYARQLGYDARYFSKVIGKLSGGIAPLEWIGNYVALQTKKYINAYPRAKIREVAENMGFHSTAHLCRYFKRVTGIYPQEYKVKHKL